MRINHKFSAPRSNAESRDAEDVKIELWCPLRYIPSKKPDVQVNTRSSCFGKIFFRLNIIVDRFGPVSEHILYEFQPSMVLMSDRHNQNKGQFNKTVAQFVKTLTVRLQLYTTTKFWTVNDVDGRYHGLS